MLPKEVCTTNNHFLFEVDSCFVVGKAYSKALGISAPGKQSKADFWEMGIAWRVI